MAGRPKPGVEKSVVDLWDRHQRIDQKRNPMHPDTYTLPICRDPAPLPKLERPFLFSLVVPFTLASGAVSRQCCAGARKAARGLVGNCQLE